MARLKLESSFFDITHPCLGCGKDKEQKRLHRWILALSSQTKSMPSKIVFVKGPVIIYRLGGGSEYLGGDHMVF